MSELMNYYYLWNNQKIQKRVIETWALGFFLFWSLKCCVSLNLNLQYLNYLYERPEAVVHRCSVKKLLEILQNLQENICAKGLQLY